MKVPEVPIEAVAVLNETLLHIQGHGLIHAVPFEANDLGRLVGS